MPRKTILRSFQSPGDVLMLTAAVRDLHLANPGQFLTDVRTSAAALWENNPHLTPLNECEPGVETIDCHYPLIHQSSARPYHFIHGYAQFLDERLGVKIPLTRFAGEIHLSAKEQNRPLPFADLGLREGFWIVMAGGKYDFTAKWWDPAAYQAVIDHFQGRIQFAQCGEAGHFHPPLERVINLVGKTSLREFVVLMHHAAGVLCPVTFAMHLAAAVPMRAFDSVGNALRGVPRGAVGTAEDALKKKAGRPEKAILPAFSAVRGSGRWARAGALGTIPRPSVSAYDRRARLLRDRRLLEIALPIGGRWRRERPPGRLRAAGADHA